ncbi:MAG: AlkZ family DNA glycosylase [Thermomicrobiales bacterium]|nr:AlkZ family DNA glycosylase [Thermomicrobiales bacterium]
MRFVDDNERRARLGQRHRLADASRADRPLEIARSLTAIHATDPGSTVVGILTRSREPSIAAIDTALYEDRSLVRVLALRRTVFVIDYELAPAVWAACAQTVARTQRRLFQKMIASDDIEDLDAWTAEAERRMLAYLDAHPGSSSTEIATDDPYLSRRLSIGLPSAPDATQSVASRLLTLLSAEGHVLRGRPKGSWTSTQTLWAPTHSWRSDWPERPPVDEADQIIARSWLAGHGPGSTDDFAWWTGWPKGRARKAIDRAGGVEVSTTSGPGFLLDSDLDPVPPPEPWVALLPGLDSSTMGWKDREFYLGSYRDRVFDNVGNGGPTVWIDGRIVGGWVHRDDSTIAYQLFEDVGRETVTAIDERAHVLEQLIGDVRLKPRARRWTPTELELKAS